MLQEIATIYQTEHQKFLSYIKEKVSHTETAEDILQDVFFHALQGINVTKEIDNIMGYLFTITKHKIIDWYRKKKLPNIQINGEEKEWNQIFIDMEFGPEILLFREMAMEAIIDAVDELPKKQRLVFIEQMINGKTLQQIADQTGDSLNTILSRKRYAIQYLRKRLSDFKDFFNDLN